jgi:prolyl-tRNA editing enzyme YbaK/EbsC (Cys-tRNA(Pro) deacylase)
VNQDALQQIMTLFEQHSFDYKHVSHPETRTSEECFKGRAVASGEYVIGAKAILLKMERKSSGIEFNVLVLPGDKKIDSKMLKKELQNLKRSRFATPTEMAKLTGGLVPGSMPPFASSIFPELNHLFIDTSLLEHKRIGFNVASLTDSLIVNCDDYIEVAKPTAILTFSR